ncbi:TPA: EpsG family protein [Acinetobacter baumannii]
MNIFEIKVSNFWATIAAIVALLASLYLNPHYIYGDQEHYREFFKYCFYDGYSHAMQLFCYQNTLGSTEPGYFYISKFAHIFMEKDTFIAVANAVLVFFLTKLIFKWYRKSVDRYLFVFLTLTNYYLVVLLLAAERLKFSFIFLVLAILVAGKWKRLSFFALSMFTHVQSALLIGTFFLSKVLHGDTKPWIKIALTVGGIVVFGGVFFVMQEHILSKLGAYSEGTEENGTGLTGMLKTAVFIVLAGITTRKLLPVVAGAPLVLLSYFLGAERIGMLAFILYASAVIYYKRKADIPLFIVMIYFTLKTPQFILNVLGQGVGYVGQ